MKLFEPVMQNVVNRKCPFDGYFQSEQGVLYHGTSNLSESQIETDGFGFSSNLVSKEDIFNICRVFKRLYFAGEGEGYGVLASYSWNRFEANDRDFLPTHFSTCSDVYRYTLPDVAGGETIAAVIDSKRELNLFIDDSDARQKFLKFGYKSVKRPPGFGFPDAPEIEFDCVTLEDIDKLREIYEQTWSENEVEFATEFNPLPGFPCVVYEEKIINCLEWLAEKMLVLKPIFDKCEELQNLYEYGVVYAIKPIDGDVDSGSLEVMSLKTIPPDRIIGKAIINWSS